MSKKIKQTILFLFLLIAAVTLGLSLSSQKASAYKVRAGDTGFEVGNDSSILLNADYQNLFYAVIDDTSSAGHFIKLQKGIGNDKFKIDYNGNVTATSFVGDGTGLTGISGLSQWLNATGGIYYNSGKVGIGTTAPVSLTEIQGGLTTTGAILTLGSKETSTVLNDVLGRVNFYAPLDAAGTDANLVAGSILARAEGTFSSSSNATSLDFQTGASEVATTKMTIKSNGNVGIGTTAPAFKLDISGNAKVSDGGAFGGYNPSATHKVTTPTLYAEQAQIGNAAGGLKGAGSINASSVCIEGVCQASWSGIGGTSGWTDDGATVRLTTITDNVGIGTTAPVANLDVNGSIFVTGGSGDVNLDENFNIQDVQLANKYVAGTVDLTRQQLANADVDGNGVVTEEDCIIMLAMISSYSRETAERATHSIAYEKGNGTISSNKWATREFIVNGNVGIGVASETKLNVYDSSSGPIISLQGLTTNYRGLKIADTNNNENWFIGANAANKYVIRRSGATDDVTIDATGKIGIGQTAPGSVLSVNGGISAGTYSATAAPAGGMIISGNVGIGTTAPASKLHIQDADYSGLTIKTTANTGDSGIIIDMGSDANNGAIILYRRGGANEWYAGMNESTDFKISVPNNPQAGRNIILKPSGNVEISGQIKIVNGTQGLNKVLTSDANGLATWQTPAAGGGTGDGVIGDEVLDAANATLTRSGAGTAADPYKLALNVNNANTWTALQTFSNGITVNSGAFTLPNTSHSDKVGIIYKGTDRFIHNFNYGNNGTVTTLGGNTFVGINAGNLTMGSGATSSFHASKNSAVGNYALYYNTTGYYNAAMGYAALFNNTTGLSNSAMGYAALYFNTTGLNNTAMGDGALHGNTFGYQNSAIGNGALSANTIGYNNTAIGNFAGRLLANGSSNQTSNQSIFLGNDTKANAAGDSNEVVIGSSAIGQGSNSVVLGNDSITKTILKGNVGIGTAGPLSKLVIGNSPGVSDKLLTVSDSDSPHTVAGANGILVSISGGGGIYMSSGNVSGVEGKYEAYNNALGAGTMSNHPLVFFTNNAEQVRIDTSGNVGIGTTGPESRLDVMGSYEATHGGRTMIGDDSSWEPALRQYRWAGSASLYGGSRILTSFDGNSIPTMYLQAATAQANIGSETFTDVMSIHGNGNVGIGTITVGSRLVIKGSGATNATSALNVTNSGDTSLMFIDNAGNVGIGTAGPETPLHVKKDQAGIWTALFSGTNDIGVYVGQRDAETWGTIQATQYGVGNNVNLALNPTGGNVGIGTTAMSARLSVSGSISTAISTKTEWGTAYYVTRDDSVLIGNATQDGLTFYLPVPTGKAGRRYTFKNITSFEIYVGINSSTAKIDGVGLKTLKTKYSAIVVVSDGTQWIIESQMGTIE